MKMKKIIPAIVVVVLLVCCIPLIKPAPVPGPAPAPTAAPTTISTPTPDATQTPVPTPSAAPAPFEITESFFDDALFIGDSITGMLYSTVLVYGGLGDADIVYANSLGCDAAVKGMMRVSYQGGNRELSEVVQLSGAKKVFLLLCANDLAMNMDELASDWRTLIDDIREDNPEVDLYIQSGTPAYSGIGAVNNDSILALNEMLTQVAEDTGCVYVDIAHGLMGPDGALREEYSIDHYIHFNADGCLVWIEELKDPASYSVPPTEN